MENRDRRYKCFRGYTPDQCPGHRIEVEKTICCVLLVIAVGMLLVCNIR